MAAGYRTSRWRRFTALAFVLYALFLVTAEFEHHDLSCELKTPQHCTSCASSQIGADPHVHAVLETFVLTEAGIPAGVRLLPESALLSNASSGRSPPSFS